jgi:hypothetical protein
MSNAHKRFKPISHNNLRNVAIKELLHEGYQAESIQVDVSLKLKKVDVLAQGNQRTAVECKSFKRTNEYASTHLKTEQVDRTVLCQPFFDVDEMWLVYRNKKNKYTVIKVPRPNE